MSTKGFGTVGGCRVVSDQVARLPVCRTATGTVTAPAAMAPCGRDRAAGRLLAGGAVRDLGHDELAELIAAGRRAQACLEAAILTAVGEVDARGTFVHDGALTAGAWLRMVTRATAGEAAASVRTARMLRAGTLPGTAAALAAGQISGRHAQQIADGVADAPPGAVALVEPEVLAVARTGDVRSVAAVMKAFAHALDPDGADAAALRRIERRGITFATTLDGSLAISGVGRRGVRVGAGHRGDRRHPTRVRRHPHPRPDPPGRAGRHLQALPQVPDAPTRGGGHPHVLVTVDQHTLTNTGPRRGDTRGTPAAAARRALGSPGATLSWVGPITGATARRIACDAQHTRVLIGPDGDVLDTGSQRRFFTAAQRRAMIARDGDRCATPYCDRPVLWADGHHLIPVEDGGPTTITNGALPCAGHHQLLHEGHWQLHRGPDGRYTLTHPDGRVIGPEPHPPGHNRPPPTRRRE